MGNTDAGFFTLQNDKLRMLKLYYDSSRKICDADNFLDIEFSMDSILFAL